MDVNEEHFTQLWSVLSKLFVYLQKKGVEFSPSLIEDIRMAKTLIHMVKYDPDRNIKHLLKLEETLFRIHYEMHSHLSELDENSKHFWEKRIKDAMEGKLTEELYIPKLPSLIRKKKEGWARIKLSPNISKERLKEICRAHNTKINFESEDTIVIEGEESNMKEVLHEIKFLYSKD